MVLSLFLSVGLLHYIPIHFFFTMDGFDAMSFFKQNTSVFLSNKTSRTTHTKTIKTTKLISLFARTHRSLEFLSVLQHDRRLLFQKKHTTQSLTSYPPMPEAAKHFQLAQAKEILDFYCI